MPGQRPPALGDHANVVPVGVQARLHRPGHVPETGVTTETLAMLFPFPHLHSHLLLYLLQVRMQVDLSQVSKSESPNECLYAITFTLISGGLLL